MEQNLGVKKLQYSVFFCLFFEPDHRCILKLRLPVKNKTCVCVSQTDEKICIYFQKAMETQRETCQTNPRGSRVFFLPSLRSRHRSHGAPPLSSSPLGISTTDQPVPPRNRGSKRGVSPPSHSLRSVTDSSQLSRSAPTIMEPLLCLSTATQTRGHIQTRLGFQQDINGHKDFGPGLPARAPKFLTPLCGKPRDGTTLSVLEPRLPLKPISRGPPTTNADSEESGSSSLNLEDEEDEKRVYADPDRNLQLFWDEPLKHSKDLTSPQKNQRVDPGSSTNTGEGDFIVKENHHSEKSWRACHEGNNKNCTIDLIESKPFKTQDCVQKKDGTSPRHLETSGSSTENRHKDISDNIYITNQRHNQKTETTENVRTAVDSKKDIKVSKLEFSKTRKTTMNSEIRKNNQMNQSFHIKVCKSGLKNIEFTSREERIVHLKTKIAKRPQSETVDRLSSNTDQQLTPAKELKTTHSSEKTRRSKSAVDHITHRETFQQIQMGDEEAAIRETFVGPVFENLQVSSSCGKPKERQSQSAPTKNKEQVTKVNERPFNRGLNRVKRGPAGSTAISGKSKAKPGPSRTKPPLTAVPKEAINTQAEFVKGVGSSDDRALCWSTDQNLSTISTICKTETSRKLHVTTATGNGSQQILETASSPSPQQNSTRTASGSRCHTPMSPVYRKFLDEAGVGPLTDDLLQCLAEELISLDKRDSSMGIESSDQSKQEAPPEQNIFPKIPTVNSDARLGSELAIDDPITWKKGEELGKGAYGTVYCGLTSQGQLIAVKQVILNSSDPDAAKKEYCRLQGEVELLKTLQHINIVGFLGTSLNRHVVSIFMEYIPGGSIASIIHRFGPLPERVLALYTQQILEGVAYLHRNRVIHRDIKGNNVMLMPTGVIKLIDFGCARRLSCLNSTFSSSVELIKSVHGTPYWMAPEVISESGYGRKSDVWSVGCTVFEMATGKPPLAHMDKMAALFYIGAKRGSMPSLPDGFSQNAKDFVKICLTSEERLRPSAGQLLRHSFIPQRDSSSLFGSTEEVKFTAPGGRL
ncbi:serine/threonine-protein kinase STE20 isoform X2 [Oryzias melastigma]|uniref:serine/threonine-protein kinase STE20 isoform X2 n=1 Tax=Oryzias melastigma TaxID=30732 RepID=UPI00168D5FF7|nr:serine/threonine-protein kinase STE20 isoform X2 [Oryzias melastigma]